MLKSFVRSLACAVILSGSALAQEEENDSGERHRSQPSLQVEEAITRYLARGGLYYDETFAPMVAPRVCRRREFQILDTTPYPRAGWVLRVEDGECVTDVIYFIHNPNTHRIFPIGAQEVVRILDIIPAVAEPYTP